MRQAQDLSAERLSVELASLNRPEAYAHLPRKFTPERLEALLLPVFPKI